MAEDTLSEEWRPVVGFPDYEVSSLGRVRRSNPISKRGHRIATGILKAAPTDNGYPRATIAHGVYRYVHKMVCEAFHGPRPSPLHEVAHGDGDRTHNAASNLRWDTNAGNHADRQRHGRAAKKLTPEEVQMIRASPLNGAQLGERLGVARSTVNRIRSGNKWGWLE